MGASLSGWDLSCPIDLNGLQPRDRLWLGLKAMTEEVASSNCPASSSVVFALVFDLLASKGCLFLTFLRLFPLTFLVVFKTSGLEGDSCFSFGEGTMPSPCSSLGLTLADCLEDDFPMFLLVPATDSPSSTRLMSSGATCLLLLAPRDQTGWLKLRYESFTLILYKELSSSIFQSLSVSESVCKASVTPVHFVQNIKA